MQKKIKIFDIEIDNLTHKEAVNKILKLSEGKEQNHICTVNPEILLKSQEDNKYKKILQNSAINTADGAGILWAANYLQRKNIFNWLYSIIKFAITKNSIIKERVTGTDLVQSLVQKAEAKHKIFFLGAAPGVAERAKINLLNKFHNESVVGCHSGSPQQKDLEEIIRKVTCSKANILLVAFGAPAQEKWIAENIKKMPNIKVAIGIGGALDFHAGKIQRAPHWMQKHGIEWLFRLYKQPKRIKRIWNATVKFPIKLLL